jgi:hypothetical protein
MLAQTVRVRPRGCIRQLRGTDVIVSTGTRAALGAVAGLAEAQPLTHIEALELEMPIRQQGHGDRSQ